MLGLLSAWTIVILTTFVSAVPISDVEDTLQVALTIPDNETGVKVSQWTVNMNVNPEELGNYLEGDIMIAKGTRNGAKNESLRWSNGVIPYVIMGNFDYDQLNLIHEAIRDYQKYTCIQLKPRTDEKDYVKFVSYNTGCWSYVGKIGGGQSINLQIPNCVMKKGTVIHEIMHAVGFWHEHSRNDRDDYVIINWNNIEESRTGNFVKFSPNAVEDYGIPYDYGSVMHYSAYAFARNPIIRTIIPKNSLARIGQRDRFSKLDYQKINKMYNCTSKIKTRSKIGYSIRDPY